MHGGNVMKKILFIGNSYTYFNDMPAAIFAPLAQEQGTPFAVTAVTRGGYYLSQFADPENEAMIQKAFAALTQGRTVIMIAHRLSTVVNADQIIVLNEGRVAEQGTHAELVRGNGLYARMWKDYNQAVQWKITAEEAK
jgi:hypothetical protein